MNIPNTERAKEIIKLYDSGKKDLFNWCDEYNEFVHDCVLYCVSSEWDYMLKKSYEDSESPVNYEDFPSGEEGEEIEVYEWWLISDPLKYRLEKQGEIFLNGAWGRCCTGQSITLDYGVMIAFLDILKDRVSP